MTTPRDETPKDLAGDQRLDVVVVGGSQAGLAMAWHLAQQGLRFLVLEAGPESGHVWRSRWDSLKLFTPAQYDALPGMAFPAPADTYPTKDPVADYLQAYATAFDLPVRLNARATSLTRTDEGFEVRTADDDTVHARQVVVATGPFQVPFPRRNQGPRRAARWSSTVLQRVVMVAGVESVASVVAGAKSSWRRWRRGVAESASPVPDAPRGGSAGLGGGTARVASVRPSRPTANASPSQDRTGRGTG